MQMRFLSQVGNHQATGDVVIPADATPEQEEELLRAAMNRPFESKTTFSTGGDVSRFERTTVPPPSKPSRNDFNPADMFRASTPKHAGPVVRVSRGKSTSAVPINPNGTAGQVQESQPSMFEQMIGAAMQAQAQGMSNTGSTIGSVTGAEGN